LVFLGFAFLSLLSYAVQTARLYPILTMSILLYCYEQLIDCISQVEEMIVKLQGLQKIEEEEEDSSSPQQSKLFDF
jgi:hypothetical protein